MSSAQRMSIRGRLALCFQEVLTATARLRDGRQVPSDAGAFRAHIKRLLTSADETARRMGYPTEFVRMAVYVTVALLDESMLASNQALASAWAGRPLQDEIFGDNVAGESFFQQLQDLLSRQDSPYVADIVEVHLLCLHLGFKGRYAASEGGELRHFKLASHEKIMRIRGGRGPLAPDAQPPRDESIAVSRDNVQRWLAAAVGAAAVTVVLAVLLMRVLSIAPGVHRIQQMIAGVVP